MAANLWFWKCFISKNRIINIYIQFIEEGRINRNIFIVASELDSLIINLIKNPKTLVKISVPIIILNP
jgi:hypothetical protein